MCQILSKIVLYAKVSNKVYVMVLFHQYVFRLMGFVGCAGVGWVLSIIGTLTLIGGPTDANIQTFIILYVIGNVSIIDNLVLVFPNLLFVKTGIHFRYFVVSMLIGLCVYDA